MSYDLLKEVYGIENNIKNNIETKTEKYPCDDCCKADVCGIQKSIKNSIDKIMNVCKSADSNVVVKPICKRFLKLKESKK